MTETLGWFNSGWCGTPFGPGFTLFLFGVAFLLFVFVVFPFMLEAFL